jgi:hypothetical protein
MNNSFTTPKMVLKLITLFALVGTIAGFVPAPRFTTDVQGVKNAIAMNSDLIGWTVTQQSIEWK